MTNNKPKIIVGAVAVILLLGGLFYWPRIGKKSIATDVPCLVSNITLVQHLHPTLKISVDDKNEIIPANIGLSGTCEHAVHTHDNSGMVHVESQDSRVYKLGDFFSVWGEKVDRLGYELIITIDGQPFDSTKNKAEEIIFKDKQEIIFKYSRLIKNSQ